MRQYFEGIIIKLRQPRTRWLLLLVSIVCVVFVMALWDQFLRDTTTQYVRSDASMYMRVSIPKYYATSQFEAGVQAFLDDAKLPISVHDIKREIAFVQYPIGTSSVSEVIIRTDRLSKVEEKLRSTSYPFKKLSGEHLIIGIDKEIIVPVKDQQSLTLTSTRGTSLIVYVKPEARVATGVNFNQLMIGTSSELVLWYGEAHQGGVALYPAKTETRPRLAPLLGDSKTFIWADTQLSLTRYVASLQQLAQLIAGLRLPEIDEVLRDYVFPRASIVASMGNKETRTGWVVADYDWRVTLEIGNAWTPELQTALERMVSSIIAFELPQPITHRLSDGTAITVIVPDMSHWQFKQGTGDKERVLDVPERSLRIVITATDTHIVITNNPDRTLPSTDRENYGQLPTQLLPDSAPWKYLRAFSTLTVDKSGAVLY